MRIAIGGYSHETNSFSSTPVTQAMIDRIILRGDAILQSHSGARSHVGGFLAEAEAHSIEIVPTVYVGLSPCAPTQKAPFEAFRDSLVEQLWAAHCEKPLDGIALDLHGAGVAEGYDDLEGTLLATVRARFGMDMPIAINLDLHANMTADIARLANVIVGYKCYPHVDLYETGRKSMMLLHRMIQSGKRPCISLVKLPWMIAPAFGVTLYGAAHDVLAYSKTLAAEEPALLDSTFFHGFSYADVPFAGASVLTVADDQMTADRCARSIAAYAWSRRHDFAIPTNSAAQAMDLAEKAEYPVVINESSDNPGGGSPGDGTHLLREMLRRDLPGSAYGFIRDIEVVDMAVKAGVGSRISCMLGAKTDDLHGEPVLIKDALVRAIHDGVFIQRSPMGKGLKQSIGTTVLLEVGNVLVVVAKGHAQAKDDAPFRIVGIDWQDMRILALKSTHHFRGWWQERAKTIVPCDSPGIHSADLASFPFRKLNLNKFPFRDVNWE